ncbi:phosphopantetheine-binding protein [Streptomyces polygonati]|uniref:Phosphopantetheine-binding protein n=1 Tax=Streptomyces polygonati TaxID=1617087 RepID=A0ABV8HHT4_9ACTN
MAAFTFTDFKAIVTACGVDEAETAALGDSALDSKFDDLGYDSLLVYEIVMRVQDDYPVTVPDEELNELNTPGELITYVNSQLTGA